MRRNPQIVKLVFSLLLISLLMAIPATVITMSYRNAILSELQTRAAIIAANAEVVISQDIDSYSSLVQVDDYERESYDRYYYEQMNALLKRIQEETEADFILTEKWIDSQTVAYVFDGTDPEHPKFSPIGETDAMQAVERDAFIQGVHAVTKLIEDPVWGAYITAYAPIIDPADHTVLGLVGVDFSAESLQSLTKRMNTIVFLSFFALIVLTSVGMAHAMRVIHKASFTDYLTGLASRRYYNRRLHALVYSGAAERHPFCLLMLDVDWFKEINDSRGHAYGDTVLVDIANAIKHNTRATDVCSRYGGDEFIILLPDCTEVQAYRIAERILRAVSELRHKTDSGKNLTVSIGLAVWEPGIGENTMMDRVDEALYRAKAQGKARIVVYEDNSALDTRRHYRNQGE